MIIHTYGLKRKRRKASKRRKLNGKILRYTANRLDNYTGYVMLKYPDNTLEKIIIKKNKTAPIISCVLDHKQGDVFEYNDNKILIVEKNIIKKRYDKRAKYFY